MKRIDPKSKPGGNVASKVGGQKALPSTATKGTTQKALPSTKPMKALTAPPSAAGMKKELPKARAAYQPPSSTYTPSKLATSAYQPPKSAVGAPKSAIGATSKKAEPIKSRTLSTGKVVASKASLPSAVKTPSLNLPAANAPRPVGGAYKPPVSKAASVAGGTKGYAGPIPGFGGAPKAPSVAGTGSKSPHSKAGSVVGGPKFF
jgi:hypothetical protein